MANYSVNYNDQRFTNVETEKQNKLNEANSMYNEMINNSDKHYNELIQASKDYANVQQQNQQARTDFAIEEINQQKEQTKKDYTKEQMGAYADYQKQSNKYGANAEALASQGLANSGYSESSQVSMYNTYQNRVMQARDSYNQAVQSYNNAITEARLTNNETLAEIAYNALQSQLQLALEGFQYKNTLLQSQLSAQQTIENNYYQRYQDVLNQINQENQFKYQQERDKIADAQWQKEYALSVAKAKSSSGKKSSSSVSLTDSDQNSQTVNLSEAAKNTLNTATKLIKNAPDNVTDKASNAKNYIYTHYQRGHITESEASYIFNQLGI